MPTGMGLQLVKTLETQNEEVIVPGFLRKEMAKKHREDSYL